MLKFELKRAFYNKKFALATVCNLIIAVFALIVEKGGFIEIQLESYKNTQNYQEYIAKYKAITNAMDVWIGCDQSMFANILFYILPLLCVLSFALSYHYDIQSAYLEKILIRTTKKNIMYQNL